jgi:hypothetical protein
VKSAVNLRISAHPDGTFDLYAVAPDSGEVRQVLSGLRVVQSAEAATECAATTAEVQRVLRAAADALENAAPQAPKNNPCNPTRTGAESG